jgi:hypothetical protein
MTKKQYIIVGGITAWLAFNIAWAYHDGIFDRMSEMDKKHNGKIPFTWENVDYIFNNYKSDS